MGKSKKKWDAQAKGKAVDRLDGVNCTARNTSGNNDFFALCEGMMHWRVHVRSGNNAPCCGVKTAINRRTALNHLRNFVRLQWGTGILPVGQVTPRLMQQFEAYLLTARPALHPALSQNSVALYMRSLSALYTLACSQQHIKGRQPFAAVFTGNTVSKKGRSLTEEEMAMVVAYQPKPRKRQPAHAARALAETGRGRARADRCQEQAATSPQGKSRKHWEQLAHHLFLLSFYFCGMPLADLLHLRRHQVDLELKRLVYQRHKTGEGTQLAICPEAQKILQLYIKKEMRPDEYVFPVLTGSCGDSFSQYQAAMSACNRALHRIGARLRLHIRLTTYVARHSWANIACHNYHIHTSVISLALAHKSEKTTHYYLDRADYADLRQAQSLFMDGFRKKCGKKSHLHERCKKYPPIYI